MSLFLHRLATRDARRAVAFYRDVLGMRLVGQFAMGDQHKALLRFPGSGRLDATLEFCQSPQVAERESPFDGVDRSAGYWKIGVTLADIATAQRRLVSKGVEVTEPKHFEHVGTLCHLRDPDGHSIELLQRDGHQHLSDGDSQAAPSGGDRSDTDRPCLPTDATFAHVTLRCSDVERSRSFYQETLGMKLLASVPVQAHDFALSFLAFTDETLPGPANEQPSREQLTWLWQRPYTVLELQHSTEGGSAAEAPTVRHGEDAGHGFLGVAFQVDGEVLQAAREKLGEETDVRGPLELTDPDGAPVTLRTASG